MARRKVIGQGTYGCIHQPSLHCKENIPLDNNHYVSKLMKTKDAEKELREFVLVSNLDKTNEYHLGTPTICEPNINDIETQEDVDECTRFDGYEVMEHPNKYRLLIQKSGGYDLSYFCKHYLTNFSKENPENNLLFWLEAYHLLKGIHFFKKHDIVHYDLKPQNIVFNPETKKFMFIDFGLMNTKTNIITKSIASNNYTANFHWSYPIDNGFLDKDYFEYYKNLVNKDKKLFQKTFSKRIVTQSSESNKLNMVIKNPEGFKVFFSYIYLDKSGENRKAYNDINSFFDSYNEYITRHSYEKVIEKTVDSIDTYGLGFTLKFVLNQFFQIGGVSEEFYRKAANLFEDMYHFNFDLRIVSIDTIMERYEQILLETGVLYALNKKIEDRKIIDTPDALPDFVTIAGASPVIVDPINLSPELEEYTHKDAFEVPLPEVSSVCKDPNKEVNPLTKRCVKKCISPKIRNNRFRCVNPKTRVTLRKSKHISNSSSCAETKERNPSTKRCVKKCPHNKIRDACFRCLSATRKNKNPVGKICSETKEINSSSGGRVKKCAPNKMRNNCFRCVTKKNVKI